VSNFEYTPEVGATKHGHATIHHVVLERNGRRTFVVDFDDADDKLLERWAAWAKQDPASRRPNVAIAPHHNADTVNITPLLDPRIRPDTCVITANPRNRFLHPGPQNTVKWIQSLGLDNVLVTAAHENIVVTEAGVKTVNGPRAKEVTLESILKPMQVTIEREITEFEELALERPLSATERARVQELTRKQEAVLKLEDLFQGGNGFSGGTGGGGLPVPHQPAPLAPLPGKSNVGEFTRLKNSFETALRDQGPASVRPPPLHPAATPRAAARAGRFAPSLRMFPFRGGIILGNSIHPSSGRVKKASFTLSNNVPSIGLIVEQNGARQFCYYEGMTATELWSAYNFVNPNEDMKRAFEVDESENGLVGKSGDLEGDAGWKFGIHPAVADTLIARDAMRLDMLVAKETKWLEDLQIPQFYTYQWYDEVAILTALDGTVNIKPASEPPGTLLRIRFWTNAPPPWVKSPVTRDEDSDAEFTRRMLKEAGGKDQLRLMSKFAREQLRERISTQMDEEEEVLGGDAPYRQHDLLKRLSLELDAFRRIERFARSVAVLHWIADTCPDGLPPLPRGLQVKRFEIPAELKFTEVRRASKASE
jgi:hypothetical protein